MYNLKFFNEVKNHLLTEQDDFFRWGSKEIKYISIWYLTNVAVSLPQHIGRF